MDHSLISISSTDYKIEASELISYVDGGSRMASFSNNLNVTVIYRDIDYQPGH